MGYMTDYSLKCDVDSAETFGRISDMLKQLDVLGYALDRYDEEMCFDPHSSVSWTYHDEDMIEVSKAFPNVLFELTAYGELPGDIWKKYYKMGMMQYAPAIITFDPFDPSKLE